MLQSGPDYSDPTVYHHKRITIMVLYEQVQEQEEKQAGAELCQAQLKLELIKLVLVWQQKIYKFS